MKKYSIGEVSLRLGLSRDTLRFYEKKGIIQPEKQENGYRSYTYDDISRLLSIMFYRRLNFSLEDIERILYKSSIHANRSMIQKKIAEEKHQLELHQQSLAHLNQLKLTYDNVRQCLNQYRIRPFRPHYKISDQKFINELGIPDLCTRFKQFQIKEHQVVPKEEFFILPEETVLAMHLKPKLKGFPLLKWETCVYTIITSDSFVPDEQKISKAVSWAKEQGYPLSGHAYGGVLMRCAPEEVEDETKILHYLELYLPLSYTSTESRSIIKDQPDCE